MATSRRVFPPFSLFVALGEIKAGQSIELSTHYGTLVGTVVKTENGVGIQHGEKQFKTPEEWLHTILDLRESTERIDMEASMAVWNQLWPAYAYDTASQWFEKEIVRKYLCRSNVQLTHADRLQVEEGAKQWLLQITSQRMDRRIRVLRDFEKNPTSCAWQRTQIPTSLVPRLDKMSQACMFRSCADGELDDRIQHMCENLPSFPEEQQSQLAWLVLRFYWDRFMTGPRTRERVPSTKEPQPDSPSSKKRGRPRGAIDRNPQHSAGKRRAGWQKRKTLSPKTLNPDGDDDDDNDNDNDRL